VKTGMKSFVEALLFIEETQAKAVQRIYLFLSENPWKSWLL